MFLRSLLTCCFVISTWVASAQLPENPLLTRNGVEKRVKTHRKCRQVATNSNDLNEFKNVKELRDEVTKLRNLVQILRDQQYLLSLLNDVGDDKQHYKTNAATKQFPELKEEIAHLKHDINDSFGRHQANISFEKKLEGELVNQRDDIRSLKNMFMRFLHNTTENNSTEKAKQEKLANQRKVLTHLENELNELRHLVENTESHGGNENVMLGTPILPLLPTLKLPEKSKQRNADSGDKTNAKFQRRDSSSSGLRKLLKALDSSQNEREDPDDIVDELKRQLSKNKRKQQSEQQLRKLLKNLNDESDSGTIESKSDDENRVLNVLEQLLNKNQAQQSKNFDDGDVEDELKLLEKAIEELQPESNNERNLDLNLNLNKLLNLNKSKFPVGGAQKISNLKKQILLLKQLNAQHGFSNNNNAYYDFMAPNLINQQYRPNPYLHQIPYLNNNYDSHNQKQYGFLTNYQQENPYASGFLDTNRPYTPPTYDSNNNFFHVNTQQQAPPYFHDNYRPIENPYQGNQQESYRYQTEVGHVGQLYTHEKIDDLKNQINTLQNVINNFNRPEYTQKPEDKVTVYNLEHQINDLKNVVSNLNQHTDTGSYQNQNYPVKTIENNKPNDAFPVLNGGNEAVPIYQNVPGKPEGHPQEKMRYERSDDSDLDAVLSMLEKHLTDDDDEEDSNNPTANQALLQQNPNLDFEKNQHQHEIQHDLNEKLRELKEQLGTQSLKTNCFY